MRPPGVRHESYFFHNVLIYCLGFTFTFWTSICNAISSTIWPHQVSVRTLKRIATPLPSPMTSLSTACGSLHLVVTTCGWFISNWTHAMPGTRNQHRRATCLAVLHIYQSIRKHPARFFSSCRVFSYAIQTQQKPESFLRIAFLFWVEFVNEKWTKRGTISVNVIKLKG